MFTCIAVQYRGKVRFCSVAWLSLTEDSLFLFRNEMAAQEVEENDTGH